MIISSFSSLTTKSANPEKLCSLSYRYSSQQNTSYCICSFWKISSKNVAKLSKCISKSYLESNYPNVNIISAGIYFTKDGKYKFLNFAEDVDKGAYCTQKDYDATINLLDFVRDEVKHGRLQPNRQYLCKYCFYQDKCEAEGGF